MSKALVINLFGGPGCGKSTTMARLFADLKARGFNVEMVSEFAKDLVYEQRQETMKDELYIFAKQHHRLFRVADKVDIIITDRPLLLTNIYSSSIIFDISVLDNSVLILKYLSILSLFFSHINSCIFYKMPL